MSPHRPQPSITCRVAIVFKLIAGGPLPIIMATNPTNGSRVITLRCTRGIKKDFESTRRILELKHLPIVTEQRHNEGRKHRSSDQTNCENRDDILGLIRKMFYVSPTKADGLSWFGHRHGHWKVLAIDLPPTEALRRE